MTSGSSQAHCSVKNCGLARLAASTAQRAAVAMRSLITTEAATAPKVAGK